MHLAIRTAVLKELLEDKEVERRIDDAQSWREVYKIIFEEGKRRGYRVKEV